MQQARRVRFSRDEDAIASVPKEDYVEKCGDPRDVSNPNFAMLGIARDQRLSSAAPRLLLTKLLWHWRAACGGDPSPAQHGPAPGPAPRRHGATRHNCHKKHATRRRPSRKGKGRRELLYEIFAR
jgi:hypothetical protein